MPTLIAAFFLVCGLGALVALLLPRRAASVAVTGPLASGILLWLGGRVLWLGQPVSARLWTVAGFGPLTVHVDRLSALFLFVTGLVFLPASVAAASRLGRYRGRYGPAAFVAMYLALYASSAAVLIAGDGLSFLLAWEAMSILCYLLVSHAHEEADRSAYLMLAMSEAGFLAVAIAFLVLAAGGPSLAFDALKDAGAGLGAGPRWAVFLLSFLGFGVKAGLVPVNSWLPRAYTAAPAAFVPVLAGATLNLGFYGIARMDLDLLPPAGVGPGLVVLIVGAASALLGILYATTDNDMKTMLAHSSIENAGIVTAGLGAGMVFAAHGLAAPAAIAFTAALYHLANHSVYKSLLFIGAGAVEAGAGGRDLDRLGGLARRMPWTSGAFLVGALSISALPPFNGFVSEWLTLQALLRSAALPGTATRLVFALSGAALALTAALAVTCFVKAFAMGFLGISRSAEAARAREASRATLAALAFLAFACLLLGITPTYVIPVLGDALKPMAGASAAEALVPPFFGPAAGASALPPAFLGEFHDLGAQVGRSVLPGRGLVVLHRGGDANPVVFAMSTSYSLIVLAGLVGLTYLGVRLLAPRAKAIRRSCWDGGLRTLFPEMTYTATGFSNPVRVVFDAVFRPTTIEDTRQTVAEHFRVAILRRRDEVHVVDRFVLRPANEGVMRVARALAALHHGRINAYLAYALLSLLVILVFWR